MREAIAPDGTRKVVEPMAWDRGEDDSNPVGGAESGFSSLLVAGLIIGALARLIKPGKQHLSILTTLLLGLVGSVIGGVVATCWGLETSSS